MLTFEFLGVWKTYCVGYFSMFEAEGDLSCLDNVLHVTKKRGLG